MMNIMNFFFKEKHVVNNEESFINTNIVVDGNTINVSVQDEKEGSQYCFYLYNINNEVIEKSKWIRVPYYSFAVETEGAYFAKVFVKSIGIQSSILTKYVDYYSEQTKNKFADYCNSEVEYIHTNGINPDYFYKMKYPYSDFALIVNMDNIGKEFLGKYEFICNGYHFGSNDVQIICNEGQLSMPTGMLFSGLTKCKQQLVFGKNDISSDMDICDNNIGNFAYVKVNKKNIEISTDYFGTAKVYYYMNNDQYVISNNYHLILLILRELGIKIAANNNLILALLCKSRQAFQQSISREREMCNVFILPADKLININEKGIIFKEKKIADVFKETKIKEKNLDNLLSEGKDEIIDNVRIVLADKRYERVLVDLTGGLDSRTVYGAVSNLQEYADKVVIHSDGYDSFVTKAMENDNSDLAIAIKLNCLNEYGYNDVSTERLWFDIEEAENQMISQSVLSGYFYPHSTTKMITKNVDKMAAFELNGFYGEICCRPYYSRSLLPKANKIKDMDALITAVANRIGILSGNSYNALREELSKEINLLPGKSLLEKWDLHYLFYRNGLHCNTIWEYEKRTPQWGPLQSKALFKYKHLTFGEEADINQQLEIIQRLDGRLHKVPFENVKDEEGKKIYLQKNKGIKPEEYVDKERYEQEKAKWWECRQKKRKDSTERGMNGQNHRELMHKGEAYDKCLRERLLEILHKLMKYDNGIFKDLFGISVFWALDKQDLSTNEINSLYQKLVAVYVQVQLFEEKE